jgi:hypothetical protein
MNASQAPSEGNSSKTKVLITFDALFLMSQVIFFRIIFTAPQWLIVALILFGLVCAGSIIRLLVKVDGRPDWKTAHIVALVAYMPLAFLYYIHLGMTTYPDFPDRSRF